MSKAPQFLQALPPETDATDGDIVTFQVKLAGEVECGPIRVTWWRCGESLQSLSGKREIIPHEDGWNELVISNVNEDDDGEYECRAENASGVTSSFGSLYYYPQAGARGTVIDVTLEGNFEECDGRQSALLILIDDGSNADDVGSNKKSLTVSEQMQGIIEDLTQSSQENQTGSMTIEREEEEEEEGQFNSDIDDLLEEAMHDIRGSRGTLVAEDPSPADKALSEGATDPYAPRPVADDPTRHRSIPTDLNPTSTTYPWPPENVVTFHLPQDNRSTTSVDLPVMEGTTEDGTKQSTRTPGADTPYGVDEIPLEAAAKADGATMDVAGDIHPGALPRSVALRDISTQLESGVEGNQKEALDTSTIAEEFPLTSATDKQDQAVAEGNGMFSSSRSSFRSTSLKMEKECFDDVTTSSFSSTTAKMSSSKQLEQSETSIKASKSKHVEEENDSTSVKRSRISGEFEHTLVGGRVPESMADAKGVDVYMAIMEFRPMDSDEEAVPLKEGQQVEVLDASKPRRWLVRTIPLTNNEQVQEGWVPACYLEKSTAEHTISSLTPVESQVDPKLLETIENREAVVRELIESEEDFSKDMQFVVENYYKQMDDLEVPKDVRDRKGSIFGNFKDICDFHNNVLMKGVNYHSKEPIKLGKTFLRLERDFDMHSSYCWSEARAQKLLNQPLLKEYFEDYSLSIGDDKILADHLKLPLQRLNDYQLLLKEIIKYSSRLDEDTSDLQKALDFIHSINKRTKDLQIMQSIQGCTGDLLKLGKMIKQESFDLLQDDESDAIEVQAFLFKGRVIVAKKETLSAGNEIYHALAIFKIQDVEVVEHDAKDDRKIVFRHTKRNRSGFPLAVRAQSLDQKDSWIREMNSNNQVTEELGEDEPTLLSEVSKRSGSKTPDLKKDVEKTSKQPKDFEPKTPSDDESTKTKQKLNKTGTEPCVTFKDESQRIAQKESASKKTAVKRDSKESSKKESVEENRGKVSFTEEAVMGDKNKPRFKKALRGITCIPGETAKLECETEGSPAPSTTWLKDNSPLVKNKRTNTKSDGQIHSLTIKDFVAEDAGLYTVVANNAHGSASCSAPLNMKLALLGMPKEDSRPSTPGGTILPHSPVFKVKLNKETQLLESTCVRFELVVRGNPEPTVKFFKDDKELKLDDRIRVSYESKEVFELILDHVSVKDAGTYSCVATNNLGSDTTTGNLSVVKHKDVFRGLAECLEEEREPTPRPRTPKFKWFRNGQDFEASERFKVMFDEEEDSLALMFQHVTPDDAGLYTCVASTSSGSKIACSAELTVQGVICEVKAPEIKAELTDVEATEGGSAMLELKITGYPKPKVTWFHKKKEVTSGGRHRFLFADEQSFTLVIKDVKKEDGGAYSVKAVNEMGEVESSCQLSVKSAPSCIKGLQDMSVMAEDTIVFEIEVDGNPAPEVKWYKDGQQMNAGERVKISNLGKNKYSLKVEKAKQSDSGSYSCVLTNSLGSQAQFSNVVVKASPTFVREMKNAEGLEGDSLLFPVEVNGNPKPTLKWLKDGKELKVDGKHVKVIEEGINAYSLAIENCLQTDVGTYTCEIRNEHGLKASSGDLALKTKPEFVKKLSDQEAKEGDKNLTLAVSVKGYPAPTVTWLHNGKNLTDNKNYVAATDTKTGSLLTYNLKLKNVSSACSGEYTCEAQNEMGSATTTGNLKVIVCKKKPEFDAKLNPTQLVEGKPGQLTAKISGVPLPNVTWLKDGNPITPNERYKIKTEPDGTIILSIDPVTSEDAGCYSIVAKNELGETHCDANVTTIPQGVKPEFTKQLDETTVLEGQPLVLSAKVTGHPTSIKWQKDGKDLSPNENLVMESAEDGTITLRIPKAHPTDAGKYAVLVSNAEGKNRSAALVVVKACSKPTINSSLQPLTLVDGETGQLKAEISGEPKPTIKWTKDGKDLKTSNRVASIEDPAGTFNLTINNARPEDAGSYSIVAENTLGESVTSASVTINQAPTFQKPLGDVDVVEGYPAKFEAKLSGSPPPEIKWMKDGKEVSPDGTHCKEVKSPDGTVSLIIDKCKPEDAGSYSLLVKNELGEITSDGNLKVAGTSIEGEPDSVPSFLKPLGDLSVREGDTIKFEASISGNPLPQIDWTFKKESVINTNGTLITFDGKKAILEIKNSKLDHVGPYACIIRNALGSASSEGTADVQGKSAPLFVQHMTDYNGFVGSPMMLSCKMKSVYPEPEIDWYFNGNVISPGTKYATTKVGDMLCLSINGSQLSDSGIYECRASNSVGEDRTRSAVNISDKVEKGEPPSFLKKIGDCEVMVGMTAKFTACITGNPTPDVQWTKDHLPLEMSSRHKPELESTGILRLVIKNIDPSDYGEYSVAISNTHGSATSSAYIHPDSLEQKFIKPMGDQFLDFDKFKKTGATVPLSDKPKIIRMSDDALTLAWKPSVPNTPRTPVTYEIEMAKHPGGEYEPYKTGLRDTLCDVRGLIPNQDYKFRIRVRNDSGCSEPSPYTTAHRTKLREPPKSSDFEPWDYEIGHAPLEKIAAAPKFLSKIDSMYGVRGHPVTLDLRLYGHPEPEVTWYKDDVKIGQDKYNFLQDSKGKVSLFFDCMSDGYAGVYTCHAKNSEGEAKTKVKLSIAEHPHFTLRLNDTNALVRRSARMQCQVTGVPYPDIKWYRDWHPLYESDRVKILWEEPDKCTLFLTNLITRDSGLFSCSARNVAGTATSSGALNVEDSEDTFDWKTYSRPVRIKPRAKKFEDFYDIGDELGRGTQAVVRHAVKRESGDSYAAKMMTGIGKLKDFMRSEMDIMNQLSHPKLVRLCDAYETASSMTLVTDICDGRELLSDILNRGSLTERQVANYIKQLLEGLDHMHMRYIGHLGLTIGDIMVARVNSFDIKFGDFGLAAHLIPGKDYILEYGHPEFVAPEIANKQPATLLSDSWSVGVITYLLLSGISPFLGEHDRETLTRLQKGQINFSESAFSGVTDDAKDFMSKLLVFDSKGRMNIKSALQHRWINEYATTSCINDMQLNNIERLREYHRRWKDWYANASCRTYYRRRTLESCFHHPSKMIYPPGESYTPEGSAERDITKPHVKPSQFDDTYKQRINREEIEFRSESNYQSGPDTYLLQLRDPDFPLRIRQYLRVGARTSPALAANLRDCHWGNDTLVIRERRKFVDIMDEEIDDEKKGLGTRTIPMRLHHEVGTMGYAHEQMEYLKKEVWKDKGSRELEIGMAPYFREKIRDIVMKEDDEVVFRCLVVGSPKPSYSWFRNDGYLLESSRIIVKELKEGGSEIRLKPSRAYDVGVYKCVARNGHGVAICKARLKLGGKPGRPEPPVVKEVSDTEVYLTFAPPKDEGHSPTLCFALEYKTVDTTEWITLSKCISHEYFVVRNLQPSTSYQFLVKSFNKFGWGDAGFATNAVITKEAGAEKVNISPRRKFQQELTEQNDEYVPDDIESMELDYNREKNPIPLEQEDPLELYRIISEMDRGRFSVVLNVWVKASGNTSVAKVIQKVSGKSDGQQEYEIMKSLCHDRIVTLLSASQHLDKTVFVMEKLSGVDVLTFLSSKQDYNEELVVRLIKQVLDAIEYLHFRGICYIELQPDNVVMVEPRQPDIKLVDFGSARFIPKSGGKVTVEGTLEYLPPEVLKNEDVTTGTDVWGVGILAYILLSGASPFHGATDQETKDNVTFIRYQFDHMYQGVTMESAKFLMQIFKSSPLKRPTVSECLEHKWLAPSEYMIAKRESARFLPDKLAAFAKQFHQSKYEAMDPEMLTTLGLSSSKKFSKDDDF